MIRTLLALAVAAPLLGQTPLRLRTGDYQSMYRVTAISGGTPAMVTVKNWQGLRKHDLADGDTIYIHHVPGCQSANGFRKVNSANPAAGTFTLTDTSDADVTCNGAFETAWQSGFLGKIQPYTLRSGSGRLFLPASGPVHDRVTDPDGAGSAVAPVVSANGPAWQGVTNYLRSRATSCCSVSGTLGITNSGSVAQNDTEGWNAFSAAIIWWADNSQTGFLNLAKFYLNHFERMYEDTSIRNRPGFACDTAATGCGIGSGDDWLGFVIQNVIQTYDLVKDQMSAEERATFRDKLFNGYNGEACTNQLASAPGGTATLTAASAIVTGFGFSAYSVGDWVYFKPRTFGSSGQWRRISSIAGDTQMTMDAKLDTSAASVDHYHVREWAPGDCGALWASLGYGSYSYGRRGWSTLTGAVDAVTTTWTVATIVNFLDPAPFDLLVDSEVVRVTAVNGNQLTVVRGQKYTAPATHANGKLVYWFPYIGSSPTHSSGPFAYTSDWRNNLLNQKLVGVMLAGLEFSDEDSRALPLAEDAWNYYYDLVYPYNKDYWSGTTQEGFSHGYRWGRFVSQQAQIGILAEYAFDRPNPIFGPYYWRQLIGPFYFADPGCWTQAFFDCATASGNAYSQYHVGPWIAAAQTFNAGQAPTAWANYWYRSLSGMWNVSGFGTTGVRSAPYVLAFMSDTDPSTDFRSQNPWTFLTENDFDFDTSTGSTDTYNGLVISKTGWGPTDTMLYASMGMSEVHDHAIDNQTNTPGAYALIKGGKTLLADNSNQGVAANNPPDTNYFEIGGTFGSAIRMSSSWPSWYTGVYDGSGGQQNRIDRKIGTPDYVYARGNFVSSYKSSAGVLRANRHLLHLKGPREYVIVYDDYATSAAKQMRTRMHYFRQDDPASVFSRTDAQISFQKPTGAAAASIHTTLLMPDGSNPAISDDSPTCTTYSCTATIDWGSVKSARLFTVHRPSAGTSDTMPPVRLLTGLDSGSVGLEIDDGDNSRAVVFSNSSADRYAVSFSPTFSGRGFCLVAGLFPGLYDLFKGPLPVLTGQAAGADGTLWFPCTGAESYRVATVSITPTLVVSPLALNFSYQSGGPAPDHQFVEAACLGATCLLSLSFNDCPWATVSPSTGGLAVIASVSVSPASLAAGTYSCNLNVGASGIENPQAVQISLVVSGNTAPPPLGFDTASLPDAMVGQPYQTTLVSSGGIAPYQWSVLSGVPPAGLALSSDGILQGTPVEQTVAELQIQVADSSSPPQTASRTLLLTVAPGANPNVMALSTGAIGAHHALLRYGKTGLQNQQTCTVTLSDTATFANILESVTDQGGRSRRSYIFGQTQPLTPGAAYYARAVCAAEAHPATLLFRSRTNASGAGSIPLRLHPPAALGTDHVSVEYGAGPALGNSFVQPCAQSCVVSVPATPDTVLYLRYRFQDAANHVLASSSVEPVVIP